MEAKNLPIKIFKKRDNIDDRRTEGGGDDRLPSWVLPFEKLQERSEQYIEELNKVENVLKTRINNSVHIPAVLKVTLHDKALAKNHRREVGKLFNVLHTNNFIGMSDECELLVKVADLKTLQIVKTNIAAVNSNMHGLSAIDDLDLYEPNIDVDSNTIKVKLINYYNYSTNQVVESLFIDRINELAVKFKKTTYAADLTIYKIENINNTVLDAISTFEGLHSITSMPHLSIGFDSTPSDKVIEKHLPLPGVEYPIVGVLDSGIEPIDHLKPWLTDDSFSAYPEDLLNKSHGTFVAGVIIYGDKFEGTNWTNFQGCKLYSAAVFPDESKEKIDEDELIENIREAINSRPDIKIWNFSGGLRVECDLNDFSDFGKFLDDMQILNDIVICKSAGNCNNFLVPTTVQRIPKSADSIKSVVVGSIAHSKGINDLADIHWPSPFSRVGFGPNNLVKPDLVHYGGNAGKDHLRRPSYTGVNSFDISGNTISMPGTSFSTPRVTSLIAGLSHQIDESFNPLLMRALTIHSAKYPSAVTLSDVDKIKQMGYGLPANIDDIIYNSPNEITLILQDTIAKGSYYEILDFPYPENLIENGMFHGEITITLVSSPLIDNNHATEYCQSNIDVSFGTYDRIKQRDTTISTVLNEIGPDGFNNLLLGSKYSKKFLKNPLSKYSHERVLRDYGDKFHPVKKYSIDLSELTEGNILKALSAPKKWILRLKGLYTGFAETQASKDGIELSQEFCLIITIKDTKKQKPVYNAVSMQLDTNNFISQNIKLNNQVSIRTEFN